MKRNTALKILNPILLLFFINQAATVLLRDHLSFKVFGIFHKTGGAIFLCLIALHFILNFNWIKASYFPHK
ncbi:MAG: hypothetical protein PHQ35_05940 [Phycisphaerae bacterium]|nr:hypothetical protein [Phycisphaerae bacterium]MDD5381280.1 hypothetical protein [Phycisphaerae bacterium]